MPERSDEGVRTVKADPEPEVDPRLRRLRTLLLGEETEELLAQVRDAREHLTDDVSRVLPEAVLKRGEDDPALARALYPPVEEALQTSVKRNPQTLIDVIFPVLGPAIRKAVRQTVSSMLEGLNRGIEYTFTLRGLKWRFEALRTRRSLAEVVLAKSLVYRVEEVFLFHRETGLPLQQVSELEVVKQDPALVTAMMTAIQDFVRDSFAGAEDGDLREFRVGEHQILVEAGPRAVIACAVRGRAPRALLETMQEVLESIHGRHARLLREFEGDAEPFAVVLPDLERCLKSQQREVKRSPIIPVITGLLIAGLGVWAVVSYARSSWENARWREFVQELREEPGIFVAAAAKEEGRFRVSGLRDPLARSPQQLFEASKLADADVVLAFQEWHSPHEELVKRRFVQALTPPPTVSYRLEGGVLRLEGAADGSWLRTVRRLGHLLPGVTAVETKACRNTDLDPLRRELEARPELKGWSVTFAEGRTALQESDRAAVAVLRGLLEEYGTRGRDLDAVIEVTLHGVADAGVGELAAAQQARARAEAVRLELAATALPMIRVRVGERAARETGGVTLEFSVRDRVAVETAR